MCHFFSSAVCNAILLLAIFVSFYHEDATAIHSPIQNDESSRGYELTSESEESPVGILRYGVYYGPPLPDEDSKKVSPILDLVDQLTPSEKRDVLALILKQKYLEFRKNLEESAQPDPSPVPHTFPGFPGNWSSRMKLGEDGPTSPNYHVIFKDKSASISHILKQLRSAEESPSPLRHSGIRPEAHPFPANPLQASPPFDEQINSETVLDDRLGPLANPTTFDPSIVVDFHSLTQLTRRLQRPSSNKSPKSELPKRTMKPGQVLVGPKSGPNVRVFRRKLGDLTPPIPIPNEVLVKEDWSTKPTNRAKYLQMPTNTNNQSSVKMEEDFSLYINAGEGQEPKHTSNGANQSTNEFGPFSQGNDPNAGIHPSKVVIPDIDVSQLRLPQGVRDTLRNYLKPIISALKPLRKNVPGLPGLDYPILSVVPYTNFYCNNMPWPGFYADTEARCQAWHACDVDGRQSTFLCPNGTVFNQAIMVCDWWYNVDCLATKYLYPLNERLFGVYNIDDMALPQTRITPELLDTIFLR